MDFQIIWFILIAVLFIGYFILEGFDFGVGILMPFISKDDTDRRVVINTIGPFWDANEVWLITAGGAMFAKFPHWYATLFSGFYLPLFVLLLFVLHGALFLSLRTTDALKERAEKIARNLWIPIAVITAIFAFLGYSNTVLFERIGLLPGTLPTLAILSFIATFVFIRMKMQGYAFAAMAATILLGASFCLFDYQCFAELSAYSGDDRSDVLP